MSSRLTITLSSHAHPGRTVSASAASLVACMDEVLSTPPPCPRRENGTAGHLDCTCTGVPAFLSGRVHRLFEQAGCRALDASRDETGELRARACALDLQRGYWNAARRLVATLNRGITPTAAMMAALREPGFHRTVCEAGVDMEPVARFVASREGLQADEVVEGWQGLLFAKPPSSHFAPGAQAALSAALQRLAGDGPGKHAHNWGACGLFATVLDGVLEAGGHYVALAGPHFDPVATRGCHHVAVRVGNWIVDGEGVSRLATFLSRWKCTCDDMHEVHMPEGGGFLDSMRVRAETMLDAEALRRDLLAAGVGPRMLEAPQTAPVPSLR